MKKIFAIACLAVLCTAASARTMWRVKVGGGFSHPVEHNYSWYDFQSSFSGKIGVGVECPLTLNLSLIPSLEYARKGWKSDYTYTGHDAKTTLNYLQIPIMAAYRLNLGNDKNLYFKVGPYIAYGLSGTQKGSYGNYDFFEDLEFKRIDAGITAGIDFAFNQFLVGLEYELGIIRHDGMFQNQAFYVTVGYKF